MATHLRLQDIPPVPEGRYVEDYPLHQEGEILVPPRAMEWDATYTPSWTNIFWGPISLVSTVMGLMRAKASGDKEGELDAKLRLVGAPFTILHALCATLSSVFRLSYLMHETVAKSLEPLVLVLGIPTVVFGLGLCFVEGIYESICLFRAAQLICHTGSVDDNDATVVENLRYFEAAYLTPSQEEIDRYQHIENEAQRARMATAAKHVTLIRRVGLTCANRVARELRESLRTLANQEASPRDHAAAIACAKEALSLIDIQAKKKLIIHIVGLAAIALCAASFILITLGCPTLLPLLLMTAGGLFATANYLYAKGTLEEEGWGFSITKAVPPLGWILG